VIDEVEVRLVRIEEKVESVLRSVACLPGLCEKQARHDERISAVERGGRWGLGIVATVFSGMLLAFAAFIKEIFTQVMTGGRP
jgi:hypothetical protein